MRNLREILRLRLQASLSLRQIKSSQRVSLGAVQKIVSQAEAQHLDWSMIEPLDDQQLARLFYPESDTRSSPLFQLPDWVSMHQELRHKGMTKHLLWEEYTQQYPNRCYSYPQYCFLYQSWVKKQKRSMRQIHKAGDKLFVDYAGQTMPVVNGLTGEIRHAQIFVAVLGASNYIFSEATWTQSLPDWLSSHARAFEFLGGVPRLIVPDNLKSGVTTPCRYDPEINRNYQQLAAHYGVAIMPARPYKPQDKAKAEVGVQIIERWILARLRHQTFFSLAELNHCIKALLEAVNHKPFKQFKGSRAEWFESLDRPALQPLPKQRYQYTDIKTVKVNVDYHIQYDQHLYSVPHHLVGEKLELHAKDQLIELYFQHQRVTSHVRSYRPGTTTVPEHMPKQHEQHHQWNAGRLMNWAQDIGDEVLLWVKAQLQQKQHEQQAYRVCLGLLNLSRRYPADRLNRACTIANQNRLYRLKQIKSILQSNQDQLLSETSQQLPLLPQTHENIRGPEHFN
jgi:transposase